MASVTKKPNGTYLVRAYAGNRRSVSHIFIPEAGASKRKTERDLKEFTKVFEAAVKSGEYTGGKKCTTKLDGSIRFERFINDYYFPYAQKHLAPSTVQFYRKIADQFLIPSFVNRRIDSFTWRDIQRFIDFLSSDSSARSDKRNGDKLNASTVKRYASALRAILGFAEDEGVLDIPKHKLRFPRQNRPEIDYYNSKEIKRFVRELEGETIMTRLLLITALYTGMRRGEIVALRWSDVDVDRAVINVRSSALKVAGEKQFVKTPKSVSSNRTVPIPDDLVKLFLKWKLEQETIRQATGDRWNDQNFVFTGKNGNMISVYTPTKICSEFQKRHKLRHIKFHALRHSYATYLVSNGVDVKTISELLGHSEIKTTDIYTHAIIDNKKSVSQLFNKITERST